MNSTVINNDVLIGSDPEMFIYDPYKGEFVSSINLLGGTKEAPMPMELPGFFVQEDNVLAEFNIPPAASEDDFVRNINLGIAMVKKRLPNTTYELHAVASAFMPAEALADPRACVFGCDPDFNAWKGGERNLPPSEEATSGTLRSAGGHLSVGYNLLDQTIIKEAVDMNIVQHCDLFLGVPSVLMDKDDQRKKLYGKAGAYRSKSFGVEYRTLSSFWLGSNKTVAWAYRNVMRAVKSAGVPTFIDANTAVRIQSAINNNNKAIAEDLVKQFDLDVVTC